MLVISCHSDTGFYSHSLSSSDEGDVVFGHLDNFVGVYAVMEAYFSGRLDNDFTRIELTYGEEEDFEGAYEVLDTLKKDDVVIVIDVTGTETTRDFVIEKCESRDLKVFFEEIFKDLNYDIYRDCPDPVTDEDEVDVYKDKCKYTCFLGIPCYGGDYNEEKVKCTKQSINSVTEAICLIVANFEDFCRKNGFKPI